MVDSIHFIKNLISNKTTVLYDEDTVQNIYVLANKTEIKQIITNMCKNAEHAFGDGNGIITITLSHQKLSNTHKQKLNVLANDFAVITIEDNGSGIAQENIDKVFEPLFTTKDVGEGTGLGLSVVIGIVRSWGGEIELESVLGRGTSFKIYIPEYKDSEDFSDLIEIIESLETED